MTPPIAVDTSVAVPLLVQTHQTHQAHEAVVHWWDNREIALSGHAVAETLGSTGHGDTRLDLGRAPVRWSRIGQVSTCP